MMPVELKSQMGGGYAHHHSISSLELDVMNTDPFYIGLAGFGTVGGGLCQLLSENADIIRRRTGRDIRVKAILVRDPAKRRDVAAPQGAIITTEPDKLTDDPQIEAIVELMGGIGAAKSLINKAIDQGKHVVTANKALLAESSLDLFKKAESNGRILRYEASVAGAIPVVGTLKDSLNGNRVTSLAGILNGTSNYILSEMTSNGLEFDTALKQAQELGYAEADPTLDIDGLDAAHKLIVLIRLAFGLHYPYAELPVTGIRGISCMDIRLAREFDSRIKLIGMARAFGSDDKIQIAAGVFPALVHYKFLLARVGGAYNALRVVANASGPLFFHGKGAGALPTAGAVLADLMAVAREERPNNTGFTAAQLPRADILPTDSWPSRFYLRIMVEDTPGVLRDISGCLANEGISVAQMIQKEEQANGVPLVFMTHDTTEQAMLNALDQAAKGGFLKEKPVYYRVLSREEAN